MKLKKLLAGITAAALAVSAMAFSSLTASAAESNIEMGAEIFVQGGEDDDWGGSWFGIDPLKFNGTTSVSAKATWDNIGTPSDTDNGKYEGEVLTEGIKLHINGLDYLGKSVTFKVDSLKIGDVNRTPSVKESTEYFTQCKDKGHDNEVEATFNLGLTKEDLTKKLEISFTVTFDPASDAGAKEYRIPFPSEPITFTYNPEEKTYGAWEIIHVDGINEEVTTYENIKDSIYTLYGINFVNCSQEKVSASDVTIHLRATYTGEGGEKETAVWNQNMGMSQISCFFKDLEGEIAVDDKDVLKELVCELAIDESLIDENKPVIVNRDTSAKSYTIPFPTDKIELTVKDADWDGADCKKCANIWQDDVDVAELRVGETTYEEVMNDEFYINGINYVSCSLGEEVDPLDIDVTLFVKFGNKDKFDAHDAEEDPDAIFFKKFGSMKSKQIGGPLSSFKTEDGSGNDTDKTPAKDDVIIEIGYEVFINGNNYGINETEEDTIIINVAEEKEEPEETIYTYEGQTEPKPYEEGKTWCQTFVTFDELFGDLDPDKIISVTFTGEHLEQIGYNSNTYKDENGGDWFKEGVSGEATLTKEDLADVKNSQIQVAGNDCTLVKWVAKGTAKKSSGGSADTPSTTPDENDTPVAPKVSSNKHQGIGMPPVIINQKSAASTGAGEAAANDTSVDLKDSTVVSKDVIDSVSGKDSVEFKLANGASWEIEGVDLSKAEGMDLGIVLDTKTATAAQLKDVAKDNDTFQFSLNYSGDFGFSAVVNIPVDAKYNGKYANLYWFNNGKFDFVGSSKVEGGIADFTMKHASDYVIVFDDEAYGEDVSSGAGIYEEESETSAPAAVVVTFAALAVSAVILKKRVF